MAAYLDENLILDMAGGDREAFSKLYGSVSDTVYGLALSILRNRQDAEDVMHDAFIRIYTSAASYTPCGKPMAWIISIVRNLCLNKIRDDSRTETMGGSTSEGHPEAEPADPEDSIEDLTNRMVIDTAMKVLDDDERQIVTLHALTGYKHKEIAEMLDMAQGTELSKFHRALKKMRNELEKMPASESSAPSGSIKENKGKEGAE